MTNPCFGGVGRGDCRTCFGTGQILSMRSAFIADGYRREKCGICSGSGKSAYRDSPEYIRFQHQARVHDAVIRRASKDGQ